MLFRRGNRLQHLSIMKCVKIFPGNLQLEVIIKLPIMIPMTQIISTIPIIINSITTIDTRSYAALRTAHLCRLDCRARIQFGRELLASCLWHSARIGPNLLCHPSSIIHRPSSAICHPSPVIRRPSSVIHIPSSTICHPSSIVLHPPSVIGHPSSVLCCTFFVSFHHFFP